jgi:hypothetical protein
MNALFVDYQRQPQATARALLVVFDWRVSNAIVYSSRMPLVGLEYFSRSTLEYVSCISLEKSQYSVEAIESCSPASASQPQHTGPSPLTPSSQLSFAPRLACFCFQLPLERIPNTPLSLHPHSSSIFVASAPSNIPVYHLPSNRA